MSKETKEKPTQLELLLKEYEPYHFNYHIPVMYKISSGSLKLDRVLDGGFPPGIHRFTGSSEGGKTSEGLEVMNNFLNTVDNSKGLIIKAEGRLSEKLKNRSGLKFVDTAKEWVPGTVFVLKCNIYDVVATFIAKLLEENPEDFKYCFMLDSLDSLILLQDSKKSFDGEESVKVCGPNTLTKRLFKQFSLPITELGHLFIVITQVISNPSIKHERPEQLSVSGAGGNAVIHFSSYILKFEPRFNKDLILSHGDKPIFSIDDTNIVGHWVNVTFEKTENEKSRLRVSYPVKYEDKDGCGGIWNELEIQNILMEFRLLEKSGAWYSFSSPAIQKMTEAGLGDVIQEKFHGETKLNAFLCKDEVFAFWKRKLQELLNSKGDLF